MASDLLKDLVFATLIASLAIVAVLLVRRPVRAGFGAGAAYRLWLVVPAAALAGFLPARTREVSVPAPVFDASQIASAAPIEPQAIQSAIVTAATAPLDWPLILLGAWALGALTCAALLLRGQSRTVARFGRLTADTIQGLTVSRMQAKGAGPAVIGVFRPRVVVPADFEARFSGEEQALILAHERAHLSVADPLVNAAIALLRCLNWFNPLAHFAAIEARVDQELACDAAVVAAHPDGRRPYAEALLKTQLSPSSLPLGCTWPVRSSNALKSRIAMLGADAPTGPARLAGAGLVALLTLGAAAGAWAALPERMILSQGPTPGALYTVDALRALPLPDEGEIERLSRMNRTANPGNPAPERSRMILMSYMRELHEGQPGRPRNLADDMAVELAQTVTLADGARLDGNLVLLGGRGAFLIKNEGTWRNPRYLSEAVAEVAADGRIAVRQVMVIDGQPMLVAFRASSGAQAAISLPGGASVRIIPTLRRPTADELLKIPGPPVRIVKTSAAIQAPAHLVAAADIVVPQALQVPTGYTLEKAAALIPLDPATLAERNARQGRLLTRNGQRPADMNSMEAAVLEADIGWSNSGEYLPDNKVIDLRSYLTGPDGKVHDFTTSQARKASGGLVTTRIRPGVTANTVVRRTAVALDTDGRIVIGLAHSEADGKTGVMFKGLRVPPGQTVTVPLPGGYSYTVNASIGSLLHLQPRLQGFPPENR